LARRDARGTIPLVTRRSLGTLPRPGALVDRYEVLSEIAHGGMAAVYEVRRRGAGGFDRVLAMKVLLPHLAADEKFVAMFLDEARIASQIQHANVVQVFDLGEHEETPFLVMERLRGRSLRAVMQRGVPPLRIAVAIAAAAARGLHAAHEAADSNGRPLRVVHRDVSPTNIHVGSDGHVKVVDFGIAAARGRMTETATGEVKGKLRYLAPEQITRSRAIDRRIDVWALGVTTWELFAGRPLFAAGDEGSTMWNVLNQDVPDLASVNPELPPELCRVVAECLSREPSQRPATAREIADRLAAAVAPASIEEVADYCRALDDEPAVDRAPTAVTVEAPAAPARGRVAVAVAAAALLVASGAGAWWVASASEPERAAESEARTAAPIADTPAMAVEETPRAPAIETAASRESFEVGSGVLVVLVDGVRRDERPLAIEFAPGQTVDVELVGERGEIVRRTLSAADRGVVLAIERPRRARASRVRGEDPAPAPATMDLRSLAKNPYP
jgi:serine/threonine-protein kinase